MATYSGVVCFLLAIGVVDLLQAKITLQFNPITVKIGVNESADVSIDLSQHLEKEAFVQFTYQIDGGPIQNMETRELIEPVPNLMLYPNTSRETLRIVGEDVGQVILGANSSSSEFRRLDEAFVRITVVHSTLLATIDAIIGWTYFAVWTISFYPQIILNWYRKSVVGLSFDFTGYNVIGYLAYCLYNVGMYWIPEVKSEYTESDPHGVNPVQINDVFFTLHAVFIMAVIVLQIIIYERGGQTLSRVCIVIISISGVFALVTLFLAVGGVISWLRYLMYFSYIKLFVTVIKYTPQVYLNYKRKSTVGFSMLGVSLDFLGGIFSLLQMLLIAYNSDDWVSLYGDPTKVGLGLIAIVYNIIFFIQHFILYRHNQPYDIIYEKINSEC